MHFLRWVKYTCQIELCLFENFFFAEDLKPGLSGLPIADTQSWSQEHPLAAEISRPASLVIINFHIMLTSLMLVECVLQWGKEYYISAFVLGQNNETNFLSCTYYIMMVL